MKIVFMGTPAFAVESAEAVRRSSHTIAAVVTVPDTPQGRGLAMRGSAVKTWALEYNLPLLQPASLKDPAFADTIKTIDPDCIVVVAFRILPPSIFSIPRRGAFNLHASLLPRYRGAAPINWAVMNGETETGVTTFFLKETVDTGTIILQERCPIGDDDTAGDVHDRLASIGAQLVVRTLDAIEADAVHPQKQDDSRATPAPKLNTEICRIDWTKSAAAVHNHVRGLSPFPGAWTTYDGKVLKIGRTRRTDVVRDAGAGSCAAVNGTLLVRCADRWLEIIEAQMEGRKRVAGAQLVQGRLVNDGDRLS
jgi:methionyl-tRNA formyltransferase